ncbi:MAG: glycosyltransferase [Flavobacteriales bacterium]
MRVLVLSHKPPYPIVDGGCLAMTRFLMDLSETPRIEHIDYVTLSTHKHPFEEKYYSDLTFTNVTFQGIEIDTTLKVFPALKALLSGKSYHTKRFLSENVSRVLVEKLRSNAYDIVICESLFSAIYLPIIRAHFHGKIYYRSHNIEYRIWEDLATNEKNPMKAWYLRKLAATLKKEELTIWKNIDQILSISSSDEVFIQERTNKKTLHVPSSMPEQNRKIEWTNERLCFLGAFDWEPNVEAVKWLVHEVFPRVLENNPRIELHIAGRKCELLPDEINGKNIHIHGFAADPLQFMAENGIFVAGLQSGSGIKMKVMEAMSIGVPCVLTTKAAEGLRFQDDMPIHANAQEFISDVLLLISDVDKQQERGNMGKEYIQSAFSSQIVRELLQKEFMSID